MTALGVLLFIVFVLLSIGVHEFGHFATAKAFGIKVERFFIGFGPRLWSVRRGETEYGVAALPLGGYVRIAGMNPFEEVRPEDRSRVFKAKRPWQRAIVLGAGSFTHFVIAFGIIAAVLALVGLPERVTTTVQGVSARTPAAEAGIRPDDVIVSIDGVRIREWEQAQQVIRARPGRRVEIRVNREGEGVTLVAELAGRRPDGERGGFLGLAPVIENVKRPVPQAIGEAGEDVGDGVWLSLLGIKRVFSPSTLSRLFSVAAGEQERRADDPATVVGIGGVAGNLAREGDFAGLFLLIAGFNIFVGVANLLPLPPLDGGHLAVLAYERATRRDVDMRKLLPVSAMVVSVLITLFFLLLYLDIVKPIPSLPG